MAMPPQSSDFSLSVDKAPFPLYNKIGGKNRNLFSEGEKMNCLLLSTGAIAGIAVAAALCVLLIILAIWVVATRNKFVKRKNACEEAWATIDVYLQKRSDLVPNLVETVKGCTKHESETLQKVVEARNLALSAKAGSAEKISAENALEGSLHTLFHALAEQYPQLRANENFLRLQDQLDKIESELANARKYYNANVRRFNTDIQMFPAGIIANAMKLEKLVYFEAEQDSRENVQVQF